MGWGRGPPPRGGCPKRKNNSRRDNEQGGGEVARQIEPAFGRRHEDGDAMLAPELVEALLPRHPLLREPDDVLVQRRAGGAREGRGPAGVPGAIGDARTLSLLLRHLA